MDADDGKALDGRFVRTAGDCDRRSRCCSKDWLRHSHGGDFGKRIADLLSRAHSGSGLDVAALAAAHGRWRRRNAYFFDNPVTQVAGTRAAPLICYEQLLVWPVLQSMAMGSDAIVAIGNGWWTGESNITDIQRASVTAWAKLFDVPLVIAFNE